MLKRINYFEIKPNEIDQLNFIIVAPHDLSLRKSLDLLIDTGISLSQIKAAILLESHSASVYYKKNESTIISHWEMDKSFSNIQVNLKSLKSLDTFVKRI